MAFINSKYLYFTKKLQTYIFISLFLYAMLIFQKNYQLAKQKLELLTAN